MTIQGGDVWQKGNVRRKLRFQMTSGRVSIHQLNTITGRGSYHEPWPSQVLRWCEGATLIERAEVGMTFLDLRKAGRL